jgi:primosomal protein N' (replication factor Y)
VRVLPDEPAIDRTFDYLVPDALGGQVRVGDRVRVVLHGRHLGGWVVEVDVDPVPGVSLRPLATWSGRGPAPALIELSGWAAWRWAGRRASLLRTASPERVVARLPDPPRRRPAVTGSRPRVPGSGLGGFAALVDDALGTGGAERAQHAAGAAPRADGQRRAARADGQRGAARVGSPVVLRWPPAVEVYPVALAAAQRGNALVLCPTVARARSIARRLRRDGVPTASHPDDWALGAAGATVVGTRAATWAPVGDLAAVVVIDEHDEAHQQQQAPTWHARDVALERARRAAVPCVLTSPCPSLEALAQARLLAPARVDERAGWPVVDVVDMRGQDPRTGLLPPALVRLLRSDRRVVCLLNRTGRARLLACKACGELARCEACEAAVAHAGDELVCGRCGATRPPLCGACGATRLRALRPGVSRVREEIAALVGEPVDEVTADHAGTPPPGARVIVGTEASLHQVEAADVVAFLDFDQELLAPRYRASEQALGLLARAARLVGGKAGSGRLVVQTHLPRHEVVQAALHADPARVAAAERARRTLLRFPPISAMAEVSGAAAEPFVTALGRPRGVEISGPWAGRWLVRADDHRTLCDALAATPRPPGRLRVAVDPPRV